MRIIVADRAEIEAGILVRSTYVVISIHDPAKHPAKVPRQTGLRDVLVLSFHDAEPTAYSTLPPEVKVMTPVQAAKVWDFVDQHRAEVGARGIDGGAVTGGAGTEDQDFGVFASGHV